MITLDQDEEQELVDDIVGYFNNLTDAHHLYINEDDPEYKESIEEDIDLALIQIERTAKILGEGRFNANDLNLTLGFEYSNIHLMKEQLSY